MAQLNDLFVSGSARFLKTIGGTVSQAVSDENGNNIPNTYMKKGVDYVTAGRQSGSTAGTGSTAEGIADTASGNYSHAEGYQTLAKGHYSHSEGYSKYYSTQGSPSRYVIADGLASHAEGYGGQATGTYAHAEGSYTTASGQGAHAEGYSTTASGNHSHAECYATTASGDYSFATGNHTTASTACQFVCGKYNADNSNAAFIIGNGTSSSALHNALTITKKGMVTCGYVGGAVPSTRAAVANNTVPNLINELRYLNGAMGSVSISTAYTASSVTLPTGWYNYLWIPHRQGGIDGAAAGDNCNYGCLLMLGMTVGPSMFWIRYSNGAVAYMKKLAGS